MKKGILLCALTAVLVLPTFADYTLTVADQAAIKTVIEKVQTKPIRTQEVVIKALKNAQNKTNFTAQKKAIFAAVESGLREKTSSGDLLATSLERKEIIQSVFTQTNQGEKGSVTIQVGGDLSSHKEGDFTLDGSLKTDFDIHDKRNPKIRLQLDVATKTQNMALDTAGELRVLDSVGYILVKKFAITPDEEGITDFIAPYLNMWWKFPFDSESAESMQISPQSSFDNEQGKQVLLDKNVIPKLVYKGQKQGVSVYGGTVDNGALVDMIYDISLAQGETLTASEKDEMHENLQGVTVQTEFSLDTKKTFSAITVTTSLKNKKIDTDTINGVVTFTLNMSSQISPIVAPKDAKNMDEFIQQEL